MSTLLIRRLGSLIDISPDGNTATPAAVVSLLHPVLSYEHKELLRGHQQYSPDGTKQNMRVTLMKMYTTEQGRLTTGFGFLTRVVTILRQHGYHLLYQDLHPHPHPEVYQPDWENLQRYVQLRPRQPECLMAIANNQCGLIDASCGFGKTFIFEALAHLFPSATFDIVVKPQDVASRIMSQLTSTIPNVGLVGGGSKFKGDRITVYTADSAHYSDGVSDFLLVDEAHQLMTPSTGRVLGETWRYSRNFGFTATPKGRMDGAHARLEMHFGQTVFRLSYQEAQHYGLVVPIHVRWLPITLGYNPVKDMQGVMKERWGLWRNEGRNRMIANDVRKNYPDPDTQILILVARVDHAVHLRSMLPEFELCYGQSIDKEALETYKRAKLLPKDYKALDRESRDNMRKNFASGKLKRVIATDVWATGVDFANLQVLYRADARESEILDTQGPARVSRISPSTGKAYGEVIDCLDAFDPGFKRKSSTRRRHYAALGWSQDWPDLH